MEPVPLQDPVREYRELREEIDAAVGEVADSGLYVLGPAVAAFEEKVAEYVGVGHAVGVASGTDAILLSLRAFGVGEGDEVITSPFTFFATAEAILHAGARPVFADVRPDTFELDPAAAEAAITDRTAALLPVHLFGQMADMGAFREVAGRHGLALVEDAAQAMGAWQEGADVGADGGEGDGAGGAETGGEGRVRAGAAGDAAAFSFYPTKSLGGWGDGGLVTTGDAALADRVRALRDHGQTGERFRHAVVGHNSRLDALQAAVLDVKLDALEGWIERRRGHARAYDRALAEIPGLEPPAVGTGNRHVYHQYTVRCRERERVVESLREAEVGYGVYYPSPLHRQEPLAGLGYRKGDFPEAERAAREALSLPMFPGLEEAERDRVVDALARAAR